MYRWLVFVHLVGVFGFLLSHGVSVGVTFALRRERDPARVNALLRLSGSTVGAFYASTALLLAGGIWAGFRGHWWSQGWIWVSLGTFVAMMLAMYALALPYYRRLRRVMQIQATGGTAVEPEELEAVFATGRPLLIAAIGVGGLLFILYLMVLKPF